MPAYVIGHITIKDTAKWDEYRRRVPATLAPWGGEVMLRGRRMAVLSGTHAHAAAVVIRFPDSTAIEQWYASAAYQALLPLRLAAAEMDLVSFADGA